MALLVLLLLFAGRIRSGLTPDFRLAAQFALVLPALWMALRLGPRGTAAGTTLLALSILVALWTGSRVLPEEAFRFSQLFLLVLALATLTTAAAAEEARAARQALELRDLQGQRMEAVATLAGGLVHEFNNQLTVMLGNLDRLREPLAQVPAATGLLARLEEAALALEGTVRQLRGLSHQAPLRAFSLPLEEALAPFLAGVRDLPARIRFEAQIPEGLQVGLDPELLRQALQLLFTNSLEAIEGRGHIRLTARPEGACICLVLEDDGHGMAPEVLRRACDPFFTTKPVGQGRGLGLSIAFSLARQMGGDLVLDSTPGRGTRAELHLPRGRALEPVPQPPGTASHPRRILLADDEAAIRELAREILEEEGFEVVAAQDGQAALEAFEAAPDAWDLAILDLVMPPSTARTSSCGSRPCDPTCRSSSSAATTTRPDPASWTAPIGSSWPSPSGSGNWLRPSPAWAWGAPQPDAPVQEWAMDSDGLFVYGTLREGGSNHAWLRRTQPEGLTRAWTPGRLFHLPEGFPALVPGDEPPAPPPGPGWVVGDFVGYEDPGDLEAALADLDALEGVEEDRFSRALLPVVLQGGHRYHAWAHVFHVERLPRLERHAVELGDGDWGPYL
jgi:signal transduction histidine kinase/gamma-glutamylcyclotransferase (GGCT)/AIG2-like uncharacterized protein YtfP